MNDNYISKVAESKIKYHRQAAKMPFEEKFKIILALQKIDVEMRNNSKKINNDNIRFKVWDQAL
jgi:hypothetical protein